MSGVQGLGRISLKRLITYGDHLKVNQPNIDSQHEAIFELAFEIEELWHNRGDLDQIKALAENSTRYLRVTFNTKSSNSQPSAIQSSRNTVASTR